MRRVIENAKKILKRKDVEIEFHTESTLIICPECNSIFDYTRKGDKPVSMFQASSFYAHLRRKHVK